VNIYEIAQLANVSRTTVSRVINKQFGVSEETRRAVQSVIDETGYVPSAVARSLATNRSYVIGALVHNITQPFWHGVISGIESGIHQTEYSLFLANSKSSLDLYDHDEQYKKNLRSLVARGADGIIIALVHDLDTEDIDYLESCAMPYVVIQNHLEDSRIPSVNVDNIEGAYTITKHLISLGHRRIIYTTGSLNGGMSRSRIQGFAKALDEADIPLTNDQVLTCGILFNDGYWGVKRLISDREKMPTAIVCSNDLTGYGACLAAREAGLDIPGDLSITGFDNLKRFMDIAALLPDLTSMGLPVTDMGSAATAMLLEQIESGNRPPSRVFPMYFHQGGTVTPPKNPGV